MRSLILLLLISVSSRSAAGPVTTRLPLQDDRDGERFTIAIDADLVLFNVQVVDSRGRHIAGLKAGDFQVREENRLQEITLFNAEDGPASIGLVIDNSGSMREKHADVTRAALDFVSTSNPDDEIFVVTFNEHASLVLPPNIRFTRDMDQIHAALVRNPPTGRTALYDALALGINHLKGGTRDHKALVVLSDGGDNASHLSLNGVLQLARMSSATVYTIGIYDESDLDRNPRVLRKIAESSGTHAFFPESRKDMERVWRDIGRDIRSEYTIGYHSSNPTHDGKFRAVRITAKPGSGRDLKVLTRDGYVVSGTSSVTK